MQTTTQTRPLFPLKIFKGRKAQHSNTDAFENVVLSKQVQLLADAAYAIAVTALWNGEWLSPAAQQTIKSFTRNFLLHAPDRQQAYTILVERILLARAYVNAREGRFIPTPEWWLDAQNEKGFAGTERWWKKLAATRESSPLFRHDLKVIAEAVADMLETPNAKNFHYWRLYFIERDWQAQLNLFLAIVANMKFS